MTDRQFDLTLRSALIMTIKAFDIMKSAAFMLIRDIEKRQGLNRTYEVAISEDDSVTGLSK
jgi:hypothetical protein